MWHPWKIFSTTPWNSPLKEELDFIRCRFITSNLDFMCLVDATEVGIKKSTNAIMVSTNTFWSFDHRIGTFYTLNWTKLTLLFSSVGARTSTRQCFNRPPIHQILGAKLKRRILSFKMRLNFFGIKFWREVSLWFDWKFLNWNFNNFSNPTKVKAENLYFRLDPSITWRTYWLRYFWKFSSQIGV